MRHWLIFVLLLALAQGCAMFHKSESRMEAQYGKKKETKEAAPKWDPTRDQGEHYTPLSGPYQVKDMAGFAPAPGKTFFVKVRDWTRGPEGLAPTESGVVYLEQQSVKALEAEGYVHVITGQADYAVELHVLCADPAAVAPAEGQENPLALPDSFDQNFPFPWSKEYHVFGADPSAAPGRCKALALLAVHAPSEDRKSRDIYVQRFSVGNCRNEPSCPFSACGHAAGRAVAEELGRIF